MGGGVRRTTLQGLPGSGLVGGLFGVVGHAARGVGDTVSVLGRSAEEILAETGQVRGLTGTCEKRRGVGAFEF